MADKGIWEESEKNILKHLRGYLKRKGLVPKKKQANVSLGCEKNQYLLVVVTNIL